MAAQREHLFGQCFPRHWLREHFRGCTAAYHDELELSTPWRAVYPEFSSLVVLDISEAGPVAETDRGLSIYQRAYAKAIA